MKLDSARSLKKELTQRVDHQFRIRPRVLGKARLSNAAHEKFDSNPPLALGITHHRGEHKLAIRIQDTHAEVDKLVSHLHDHCKGEVHVKFVGQIHAQSAPVPPQRKRKRPIGIGQSVGLIDMDMGAGTIAFFAEPNLKNATKRFIVSNNHVLANENNGKIGEPVIQPGPADGGAPEKDSVARLHRYIRLKKKANIVDAAIAEIDGDVECDMVNIPGIGKLKGVRNSRIEEKEDVAKYGRTTGVTRGVVSAFEIDGLQVQYPYPLIMLTFDDQMEIEPKGRKPFSFGGDSGSLVVDSQNQAVGLLFAGNNKTETYVNLIDSVLRTLRVRIAGI